MLMRVVVCALLAVSGSLVLYYLGSSSVPNALSWALSPLALVSLPGVAIAALAMIAATGNPHGVDDPVFALAIPINMGIYLAAAWLGRRVWLAARRRKAV
jgi:hypothetical protein